MRVNKGRPNTSDRVTPPGHKWCPRCNDGEGQFKKVTEFRKNDGYCIECRREYTREWRAKKRGWQKKAELWDAEVTLTCAECGKLFTIDVTDHSFGDTYECPWCDAEYTGKIEVRFVT